MNEIYRAHYLHDFPSLTADLESTEMIKYATNAFLATKLSFINGNVPSCERVGADVKQVSKGMGRASAIKSSTPTSATVAPVSSKGTEALAPIGPEHAVHMQITKTVTPCQREHQTLHDRQAARSLRRQLQRQIRRCAGVTFKPNTGNLRDAPSLPLVPELVGGGSPHLDSLIRPFDFDSVGAEHSDRCCPIFLLFLDPFQFISLHLLDGQDFLTFKSKRFIDMFKVAT